MKFDYWERIRRINSGEREAYQVQANLSRTRLTADIENSVLQRLIRH
jgi:hypothetical protein